MELNENAKKWVAALRSGKYQQGRGYLCHMSEGVAYYCCLGVAVEVAIENGINVTKEQRDSVVMFNTFTGMLDPTTKNWLGLSDVGAHSLVGHNDIGRISFNDIADRVEANPDEYFSA